MGCASEEFFARATTPLGYHDGAASRRCSCPRCYACCCTCCCPICSRWTLRGPMRIAPACCHQTPARRPAVDVEQHSLSRCSASSSLRGGAWSVSSAPAERCAAIRRACFDLPSNRPARQWVQSDCMLPSTADLRELLLSSGRRRVVRFIGDSLSLDHFHHVTQCVETIKPIK